MLIVNPNHRLQTELSAIEPPLWAGLIASRKRADILDAEAFNLSLDDTEFVIRRRKHKNIMIVVMGNNPSVSSTPKMPVAEALAERLSDLNVSLTGIHPIAAGSKFPVVKIPFKGFPMMPWRKLNMGRYRAHNWHCLDGSPRSPYASIYTSLGCPFDCYYCLPINTPILMADLTWKPIQDVKNDDMVIGIDEKSHYVETKVTGRSNRKSEKLLCIKTEMGSVRCTKEHMWLTDHKRYRPANKLKVGQYLRNICSMPFLSHDVTSDYRIGYLAGSAVGDGSFNRQLNKRGSKSSHHFRLVGDLEMMDTFMDYALKEGLDAHWGNFQNGVNSRFKKPYKAIYVTRNSETDKLLSWVNWVGSSRDYKAGFLSGFYDAEGSYSCNNLRIANLNKEVLVRVKDYLYGFCFDCVSEERGIRITGGISEHIRFFALVSPKVVHKRKLSGRLRNHTMITEITDASYEDVYNIETESHNFIASGFVSHNCNIHTLYPERKVYLRPIEDILGEVNILSREYGVRNIKIWDELFALDEKRVIAICRSLEAYNLNMWAYGRLDTVTEKMLKAMKKAGINWLAYGFESVRDKKFISRAEDVVKMTKDAGINIIANFMFGLPGTTKEDDTRSVDFAKKQLFEYVNFYNALPYPGSQWYDDIKPDLPWSDYDQYNKGRVNSRRNAFLSYFGNLEYQSMIRKKFGQQALDQIVNMLREEVSREV